MGLNRSAERTITCPICRTVYPARSATRELGMLIVHCPQCGPTPWRALLPRRDPLIIDRAALAAHREHRRA